MSKDFRVKTWLEISERALRDNLRATGECLGPRVERMAVIKANAYGHGLAEVAKIAHRGGAAWLGVDSIDEAIAAKKTAPAAKVLILGYVPLGRIADAQKIGVRLTVYNEESIREIGKTKKKTFVHIKLETGTTRQGVGERGLLRLLSAMQKFPHIVLEGLSTHYANIEDTSDHRYAAAQLKEFVRLADLAEKRWGSPIPVKHTACSAAVILFPETHFNLARIGIALYGLWSSEQTKRSAGTLNRKLTLNPALSWKALVAQVKEVPKGTPVSYGLTKRVERASKVAVIPVGYSDGFDRGLSSVGHVLIRGKRAPALGRICMNMFMVDVTGIPGIKIEDEVVLLGRQGREEITAEEIAKKTGTINYEVVSRLNPLMTRRYILKGSPSTRLRE